ncbi:unnamed protein product [Rhizophagus irregularis]|nr:unnamed protein product [Rhizophagus irregularis]
MFSATCIPEHKKNKNRDLCNNRTNTHEIATENNINDQETLLIPIRNFTRSSKLLFYKQIRISKNQEWNYDVDGYQSSFIDNRKIICGKSLADSTPYNKDQCEFEFWTRSVNSEKIISSSDTIMSARKYVRIHGPGAERVENPIFIRTTIPREKLDQMQQ